MVTMNRLNTDHSEYSLNTQKTKRLVYATANNMSSILHITFFCVKA